MSAKSNSNTTSPPERAGNGRPAGRWVLHERVTGVQRARILVAMAEVCAELGGPNVTVAHIVARSGISRRTFYEQFTDREDCFLAALEEAVRCAARYVVPAYHAEGRWRERIRAALVALLEFLEDEPYMGRLLVVEALGGGERSLARRQEVLSRVLEGVDEGRKDARDPEKLAPLTAEGAVGGVLSILHARLAAGQTESLLAFTGQLTSLLVLPYLGPAAAARELSRPVPQRAGKRKPLPAGTLHELGMRLTYRTIRILLEVATHPGASNRELGTAADIQDQGQVSKLLSRLAKLGLIENTGAGHARGGPNAWMLTERGVEMQRTIAEQTDGLAAASNGLAVA